MNNGNLRILSPNEARENGRKGGIKSGQIRKERKALKEQLLMMLESGDIQENICLALIDKAQSGDIKAFEVIRDTIGEKPVDREENEVNMTYTIMPTVKIDGKELELDIGEEPENNIYKMLQYEDNEDEF